MTHYFVTNWNPSVFTETQAVGCALFSLVFVFMAALIKGR